MFQTRIKALESVLSDHEIDALLITSSYNISYLTGIRAFSIEEREARLLVLDGQTHLFTDARYIEMVNSVSSFVNLVEISSTNPFLQQLKKITEKEKIDKLGFEEESISYKEASDLEEVISAELIPTIDVVEQIRIVKDSDEQEKISQACTLTDRGFEYIQKFIKPGVTENEIKSQLETFLRHEGGDIAFSTIVAFGKNSAIPHHMSGPSKLAENDIILLDFGAKVDGYCSDMTRTLFIGKPDSEMKNIYSAVKESQEVALDYLKTHALNDFEIKTIQHLANSHLKSLKYPEIPHALGHGVGLQVHESPVVSPYSEDRLIPGMVITVEPGVYIPNLGGVRIEDTVIITSTGIEILTKSSKELIIL